MYCVSHLYSNAYAQVIIHLSTISNYKNIWDYGTYLLVTLLFEAKKHHRCLSWLYMNICTNADAER